MKTRDEIISSMCMTYRHDYGLLPENERKSLWNTMAQIYDNDVDPYMIPKNIAKFGNCDCGCNTPVADTPEDMLRFLAGRFEYAGVADSVAALYARDIRYVLEKYYGG